MQHTHGALGGADHIAGAASGTGVGLFDFFTGGGAYMPRVHCMVDEAGQTDWPWVVLLLFLNLAVIAGYLKIFSFWRRAYLETEVRDRNQKLMTLAWIFLWCSVCGYLSSIVMFAWPAYRLVAFCLMPLAFFTWKFAANLEPFRLSLSAKRLERELKESLEKRNEQLEELVATRTLELERALAQADAANEAKSLFLANMSHEIRTPMNAIVGFTDLLDEARVDESAHREHVDTIRRNTDHLLGLINDVLDLSKIEAGKLDVEVLPTNARAILEDVQDLFLAKATAKGVGLRSVFGSDFPAWVRTDPTRLKQVVANLVSNAVKFTEEGSVTIAASHVEGRLRVSVRDTGPGIDREAQERLFERFTQADASTTRRYGGTGLGLRISRDLVDLMGGELTLESEPGRGATFRFEVPAPVSQERRALPHDDLSRSDVGASLRGVRVLLADDGEDNARLATFCLERAGASVTRALHGAEALSLVELGESYDLIVMDMHMPVMDGFEATRELRRRGFGVPILAATASAMLEDRRKCADAGCDGFLSKPFRRVDLLQACDEVLRGGRRRAA